MKHGTTTRDFKIIKDSKRVIAGGIVITMHGMYLQCECAADRCTCPEEDETDVVFFVRHNTGKRKFVRSMGLIVGYGRARRLWASAKLHEVAE